MKKYYGLTKYALTEAEHDELFGFCQMEGLSSNDKNDLTMKFWRTVSKRENFDIDTVTGYKKGAFYAKSL